jgi:hypothetical protein
MPLCNLACADSRRRRCLLLPAFFPDGFEVLWEWCAGTGQQTGTVGAGKECIRMLSTCPPRVAGVALAVSSCPTTRCCWCCSGRLKLSDDQVLLQRCFPLNRQLQLLSAGELPFSSSYEKKI